MIEGLPIGTYGPGALVSVGVLCIMFGLLVPRKTYLDALHDRDMWRAAHMISEQARAEGAAQVEELLEHARTTDAFIRAIPRAASTEKP